MRDVDKTINRLCEGDKASCPCKACQAHPSWTIGQTLEGGVLFDIKEIPMELIKTLEILAWTKTIFKHKEKFK